MIEPVAERRISDKAFVGHYVGAALAGILIMVACFVTTVVVLLPLALLPAAGVWAYSRLARAGTVYRLYADRLEMESGILNRKIENVELFRIRDVGLKQGLVGRLADFGDVYAHSTDSTASDLHLHAIDAPRDFYQTLRELISRSRAQSRTMIVEEGHALPEH
jgi:membrane protein YdbS with pleckstrin-like domain